MKFLVCGQTRKTHGKSAENGEKLWRNANKTRKIADSEIFSWGRGALPMEPMRMQCVANTNLQTRTRCMADVDYLPASTWEYAVEFELNVAWLHSSEEATLM